MKRAELKDVKGRFKAIGKIKRFGLSNIAGEKIITMLLLDVKVVTKEERELYFDHAWVRVGPKTFMKELREGSVIEFDCVRSEYYKAPDYKEIQGYGIRKVRNVKIHQNGKGMNMEQFIYKVKEGRKLMEHLIS